MTALSRPDVWIPLTALAAGLVAALLFRLVTLHYARRRESKVAAALARHATRPLLLVLPVIFARLVQPLLDLDPAVAPAVRHAGTLLLILGFGWLLISLVSVLDERLHERLLAGVRDERRVKRILTRVGILDRVLTAAVVVLTAAAMLVTFPEGRAFGTSILASAGIAGLVLGIAARPAAENLIAGLRVALTEPFQLDDVVIVEGEWGRIEEITSAYVVVRIWDLRRLIVPLGYFLERPFQNWSRSGTALLAQVTVEVDYSTPVAKLRENVGEIVAASPLWDRGTWNLQVVEAGERTMRLRVLASAADSGSAWDLRCEIREKLIAFLQEQYPWALPRVRATVEGGAAAVNAWRASFVARWGRGPRWPNEAPGDGPDRGEPSLRSREPCCCPRRWRRWRPRRFPRIGRRAPRASPRRPTSSRTRPCRASRPSPGAAWPRSRSPGTP